MKKFLKNIYCILAALIIFLLVIVMLPINLFANGGLGLHVEVTKATTGSALSGAIYDFYWEKLNGTDWVPIVPFPIILNQPAGGPYNMGTLFSSDGTFRVREVEKTVVATYSGSSLASMPDSNITTKILVSESFYWDGINSMTQNVYFRNVMSQENEITPEPVWIRDREMTCYRVWTNSDNKFEMVFWWPYSDNNWVKIYDMYGKEVYSRDIPYDNPHIVVDLPDGMYTVKTFHDQPEPLQTFIIGKP